MYTLFDTHNNQVLSKHRTVDAAIKADKKMQKSITKRYGASSYIPTVIRDSLGKIVDTYQH